MRAIKPLQTVTLATSPLSRPDRLDEGNQTVTNCNALKMTAAAGKQRMTDVADTEQLLRLIQSIPSPKAEPFSPCHAKECCAGRLSRPTPPGTATPAASRVGALSPVWQPPHAPRTRHASGSRADPRADRREAASRPPESRRLRQGDPG